ncbi:MAG: protease HtpX [Thermoanaerobaculaceae bacterium]|nr:protease HtpX [Thermoanaerobaculaceae bacterium]MDI9621036.1 protease HtpX [Acidobacteriota bacterium]NLH11024.1 protease HtpX [Holophagae bacterium]HPW55849.1 protease HtpX [Thermoanaerobaculaceae bacterium]
MASMKRVFLFVVVNILIVITISLVLSVLGVRPYLSAQGIDLKALAVFCLIWGMGGAFISLALSRVMAKWMMGVQIIEADQADPGAREVVNMVHTLARAASLPAMPQVGIYQSPEVNAFATGPTKRRALVAVSTGLLQRLDRRSIEGVLGHEITHIANGDMVTMTLLQGVINAFVMFLARVLAFVLSQFFRRSDDEGPSYFLQYMLTMVLEIVFSILGAIVVATFSRWREYRADAGGARLAGRESMIGALESLLRSTQLVEQGHPSLATFKISSGKRGGLLALFATHPPLEERIARLRRG